MEIIKYKDIDVKIDYENKNVWLTQEEIAKLYKIDRSGISKYIKKIYESGLLDFDRVCANFAHNKINTNNKSNSKMRIYNIEVIKAIGYKVNSNIVILFTNWVEDIFNEYSSKNAILTQKSYEIVTFIDNELQIDVNVDVENDTVWLTQSQIAELFSVSRNNISEHIKNIFCSGELLEDEHVGFSDTLSNRKIKVKIYDLEIITLIGHRVNTKKSLIFRKWVANVLRKYISNGYSINEKRCLSCQENLINLNNKVNYLLSENDNNKLTMEKMNQPENFFKEKLLYENKYFDGYAFIRKLFLSAKSQIIIIDGYVSIEVLEMLEDINIDIFIYTYTNAAITNKDIRMFSKNHNLTVNRISNIHDRYIIIDDDVYILGCSIKDIGKKTSTLIKLNSISKEKILNH